MLDELQARRCGVVADECVGRVGRCMVVAGAEAVRSHHGLQGFGGWRVVGCAGDGRGVGAREWGGGAPEVVA